MSIFSFLKILLGGGINATSEELLHLFVGQTYPPDQFLDLVAELQRRQGKQPNSETIFASASACCAAGVIGALSKYKTTLPDEFSANLHSFLIGGWARMYKDSHENASDVEVLRRRILDAFSAISRAATSNPTKDGTASSYHAARKARLLVDPDEASLEEPEVTGFEILIEQKYKTALGFFKTLKRNRRL
jgi:hypothetical protein